MKTTGLFTVHEFTIRVDELGKPIYLYPLGDVHKFAPLHSSEKWDECIDKIKSHGPDAYIIGMGDYMELMRATDRSSLTKSEFCDNTIDRLDKMADSDTSEFSRDLEFAQGRIIGLIEGNHYFQFKSGETSTQRLCRILDTKYLGVATLTRLRFDYGGHTAHIDIYAHHGKGAARLLGGSLNRVQQMAESCSCDLYCMGHDHKGPIGKNPRLQLSEANGNLALIERTQLFVRTGSFLRGYVDGEVSYVADACLNPANLGCCEIVFIPGRPRGTSLKIEMHATI